MSFELIKLGQLVKLKKGKKHLIDENHHGIRYLQIEDLRNDDNLKYTNETKGVSVSNKDVIIAWDGANAGTVGWNLNGFIGSTLTKIEISEPDKLLPSYLGFFLKSRFKEIRFNCTGATIPHVNKSHLLDLDIPLLSIKAQKHIAVSLSKADLLCKQAKQVEEEYNQLSQALFLEMFGDPVENQKNWEKKPLSEIVSELVGGKSISSNSGENDGFYRILKISAVTWRDFNPLETKPIPVDYIPPKHHIVQKGDLLFSRANTTELVGATSYVWEDYPNLLLPDKLWRFVWKEKYETNSLFMWNLLMLPSMREQISLLSSGSGGSMKNISKQKLMTLEVIFPPVEKQKAFGLAYELIHKQKTQATEIAKEQQDMFNILQQKAFKGELKHEKIPELAS